MPFEEVFHFVAAAVAVHVGDEKQTAGSDEILVSHHGHLVWVDQRCIRES